MTIYYVEIMWSWRLPKYQNMVDIVCFINNLSKMCVGLSIDEDKFRGKYISLLIDD